MWFFLFWYQVFVWSVMRVAYASILLMSAQVMASSGIFGRPR
jgi:hypothetical protein